MNKIILRQFCKKVQRPPFIPDHVPNYNYYQFRNLTNKYKKALDQKEKFLYKLNPETKPQEEKKKSTQPRKDLSYSQEGYYCWRKFELNRKPQRDLDGKIRLKRFECSPKKLVDTFGYPIILLQNYEHSLAQFYFADNYYGEFVIYDRFFKDPEFVEIYESQGSQEAMKAYYNQDKIMRFSLKGSKYCQKYKFYRFLKLKLDAIEQNPDMTFDKQAREKFREFATYENELDYLKTKSAIVFEKNRMEHEKEYPSQNYEFINDKQYNQIPTKSTDISKHPSADKINQFLFFNYFKFNYNIIANNIVQNENNILFLQFILKR